MSAPSATPAASAAAAAPFPALRSVQEMLSVLHDVRAQRGGSGAECAHAQTISAIQETPGQAAALESAVVAAINRALGPAFLAPARSPVAIGMTPEPAVAIVDAPPVSIGMSPELPAATVAPPAPLKRPAPEAAEDEEEEDYTAGIAAKRRLDFPEAAKEPTDPAFIPRLVSIRRKYPVPPEKPVGELPKPVFPMPWGPRRTRLSLSPLSPPRLPVPMQDEQPPAPQVPMQEDQPPAPLPESQRPPAAPVAESESRPAAPAEESRLPVSAAPVRADKLPRRGALPLLALELPKPLPPPEVDIYAAQPMTQPAEEPSAGAAVYSDLPPTQCAGLAEQDKACDPSAPETLPEHAYEFTELTVVAKKFVDLETSLPLCTKLLKLTLCQMEETRLLRFVPPSVEHIAICDSDVTDADLSRLFLRLPLLKSVHLHHLRGDTLARAIAVLPATLESLYLVDVPVDPHVLTLSLSHTMNDLRGLRLQCGLTTECMNDILFKLDPSQNLRNLHIERCSAAAAEDFLVHVSRDFKCFSSEIYGSCTGLFGRWPVNILVKRAEQLANLADDLIHQYGSTLELRPKALRKTLINGRPVFEHSLYSLALSLSKEVRQN